jgi:hypothetical protein
MASIPKVLAATTAAIAAQAEHKAWLDADEALLAATGDLLRSVRNMYNYRTYRTGAPLTVITHKEQLKGMMAKYGVELVPSDKYVDGIDIRVIGTETAVGEVAKSVALPSQMVNMDADCGEVQAVWKFPQASARCDNSTMNEVNALRKGMEEQINKACGISTCRK